MGRASIQWVAGFAYLITVLDDRAPEETSALAEGGRAASAAADRVDIRKSRRVVSIGRHRPHIRSLEHSSIVALRIGCGRYYDAAPMLDDCVNGDSLRFDLELQFKPHSKVALIDESASRIRGTDQPELRIGVFRIGIREMRRVR
jgi:hypothetical protein